MKQIHERLKKNGDSSKKSAQYKVENNGFWSLFLTMCDNLDVVHFLLRCWTKNEQFVQILCLGNLPFGSIILRKVSPYKTTDSNMHIEELLKVLAKKKKKYF